MAAHKLVIDILLVTTAASSWLGALGMLRMRDPFQALHYLALPSIIGMASLTVAVFLETGWTQAGWKCAIMLAVLLLSNSVGTHAAARAFRARQKGHWEPYPNDPEIEFLGSKPGQ